MGINKTLTARDRNCDATPEAMAGTHRKVLRILSVTALVALVVTGCGGAPAPHPQAARGLPRALAQEGATRASAVATAAAAGDNCQALQLASSLRDEIIAKEDKVPARLQRPLVQGASALAQRFTCTVPPQTVTVAPPPKKPPDHKPPPDHHKKHGRDEGGNQG
jgi:hypothetical protein